LLSNKTIEISQVSRSRIASVSKRFFAFGNKVAKADTALLYQQATCASALPTTTLQVALGTPKVAKRIYYVHKAHPPPFSGQRHVRQRKSSREFCVAKVVLILEICKWLFSLVLRVECS